MAAKGFLGINMSGRQLNVINSSGNKIGTLYHKERFTYSFDIVQIQGKKYKRIWFLNSSGKYGEGFLLDSDPLDNWMHWRFQTEWGTVLKVDGTAKIYNGNAEETGQILTRSCYVVPAANAESGYTRRGFLKLDAVLTPHPTLGMLLENKKGFYVDTGVTRSSTNTNVYGNWN